MPSIGTVTKTANGSFKGQLRTLSIRTHIEIVAKTGHEVHSPVTVAYR